VCSIVPHPPLQTEGDAELKAHMAHSYANT
jgi:hypothetical protein